MEHREAEVNARYTDLEEAPVLVTGGASGIGAALVSAFAAQDARVAFLDRDEEAANALLASLRDKVRHRPGFFKVDLADIDALKRAVTDAVGALGGLRVLVNNAGWDDRHDLDSVTETYWDENQAINLRQIFFTVQAAAPALRAAGGAIVNMSSIAYLLNMPDLPSYAAAKAGIVGLTKSLAGRLGPEGIRVNAVLPGMIVTERQKKLWLTEEGIAAMVRRQCVKRVLVAEDMAGPCLFLASAASGAITAQSIIADGGIF
ncbi:SDR family NAD(P)-dependent oxidoreductase [Gellertiella hungarica]|uniref:SDR family NAD(P)-dependent oxidoreductase n=1 Tax=Gellertiella hungarica TaxID=1572859 RepID=UPI00160D5FAF|nr:SDR family oxidoreductase [Gellertiella hungarica]